MGLTGTAVINSGIVPVIFVPCVAFPEIPIPLLHHRPWRQLRPPWAFEGVIRPSGIAGDRYGRNLSTCTINALDLADRLIW